MLLALCVVGAAPACTPLEAQEPAGPAAKPAGLTAEDLPMNPSAARGRGIYVKWCIGCHGEEGRGDGAAAAMLDPLPRDFQSGRFKFRSTPSGELPTQDDLVRTITRGLKGSSMPAFSLLPESERRDVSEYVIHVALTGRARKIVRSLIEDDGLTMDRIRAEHLPAIREGLEERRRRAQPIGIPPEPANDAASIARGKDLYASMCLSCHGPTGVGDGPSAYALRDVRDAQIRPRDFTTGVLRGGDAPQDLFRRMKTGLDGTPMPAFGNTDQELWDIVHFVTTLRRSPPSTGAQETPR